MSVRIVLRPKAHCTIIDIAGRITLGGGTNALRDTIRELLTKGQKDLILNLADVSYIDNSGIGELVSEFTTVAKLGGHLKLLNLTKRLKDLLQITKLYVVFKTFDDEDGAVRSFDPVAPIPEVAVRRGELSSAVDDM